MKKDDEKIQRTIVADYKMMGMSPTAYVSCNMMMRRSKQQLWPTINDENKSQLPK